MSIFHLYAAYFGQGESYLHNTVHVALVMVMCFILKPVGRASWKDPLNIWFGVDLLSIGLGIAVQVYIGWDIDEYIQRQGFYETPDMAVGIVMMLLVMDATRRAVILTRVVAYRLNRAVSVGPAHDNMLNRFIDGHMTTV